ncbi:MAG: CHASE domain-containing protein [Nitrospirae bacterium]|nr:CHASE domain-containing protein [Nitrospirota bacterium]
MQTIDAMDAYYDTNKYVDRLQFRIFTNHLLKEHASIQALEWIPRVLFSNRKEYEKSARREGFPDFRITERAKQGTIVSAGERKEYFPVYFVEPFKGNEIALGFDLASNPERLEAIERSRDTGEIVAATRIKLVQEKAGQYGFLVFKPVYKIGDLADTIESRRENLEGFILGVFRTPDIVEKSLSYLNPSGVDVYIYDKPAIDESSLIYYHPSRRRKVSINDSVLKDNMNKDNMHKDNIGFIPRKNLTYTKILHVAGRKWLVQCTSISGYISEKYSFQSWVILFTGLVLTFLLTGYFVSIKRKTKTIRKLIRDLETSNEHLKEDITQRKRLEKELLESERRYKTVVNSIPVGISLLSQNLEVLSVNNNLKNRFPDVDFTNKPICYKTFNNPPGDNTCPSCPSCKTLIDGQIHEHVKEIHIDGNTFYYRIVSSPVVDEEGKITAVAELVEDITEKRRVVVELKKAQEMLLRSEKMVALGELSAGVAHEIRNPLNVISTSAQILMMEDNISEEAMDAYNVIIEQVDRAVKIVDNLREFARKSIPEIKKLELNELIEKTVALVSYEMKVENIAIAINFGHVTIFINGDKDQLTQVLLNIINNARDGIKEKQDAYSHAEPTEDGWSGCLKIGTWADPEHVYVSIEDNGIGIPEAIIHNVFDPFFTTKQEGKGSGLGLSISYGIIKNHNGDIKVQSGNGKTVFTLIFPTIKN